MSKGFSFKSRNLEIGKKIWSIIFGGLCILPTSDQQCLFLRKFFLFLLFYGKVIFYSFVIQKPNGSLYYDLNVQWGIADFVLLLRLWLEIYVDPNYESQVKRNKLKTLLVKSIHSTIFPFLYSHWLLRARDAFCLTFS